MFKKLIQAGIAATLVATPMIAASAEAQQRRETVTTVKQRPNGTVVRKTVVKRQTVNRNNYRAWRKGQRFDRRYATNYRVIDYRQYRQRRLYAPGRGQQWVRSGNDAVLIGNNGLILSVIANALR
ncbi:RcnB family protein [Sphingomonas sp. TZW2008]|uniref:RcnB family protein n=1 Tax=Sphingomonas sp. TZW2008 TaxID=1917973 RepID=UPI000A26CD98|nr:RcnB family protein [Sphingomonas sp. TZW2008]